jgi:hypothetical protein
MAAARPASEPAKSPAPPETREPDPVAVAAPVVTAEPAAPAAVTAPAIEPAATSPEPKAEVPAPAETAEEPPSRRPGAKKNAKARRSSVPSWDEIMLGSSRQHD